MSPERAPQVWLFQSSRVWPFQTDDVITLEGQSHRGSDVKWLAPRAAEGRRPVAERRVTDMKMIIAAVAASEAAIETVHHLLNCAEYCWVMYKNLSSLPRLN